MKHRYLLFIALGLHVTVVSLICLAGKQALYPNLIDENGIIPARASDSVDSHPVVVSLAKTLTNEGAVAFARVPAPLHLKLYSISFAIFSPLFGYTMLSAEPLNALLYLVILCLIFNLSRSICSRNACFIATGVVALWVSFFLQTTQLLRDPLFIAGMLTLIYITASWLTAVYNWRAALIRGLIGIGSIALMWEVRLAMRDVLTAIGILGGALLLAKQMRDKRFLPPNTLGAVLVIAACLIVPKVITPYRVPVNMPDGTVSPPVEAQTTAHSERSSLSKTARLRDRFENAYPSAGSNIDVDVRLESTADILR